MVKKNKRKITKEKNRNIAKKRIDELFSLLKEIKYAQFFDRWVELALLLSRKNQIRLGKHQKLRYCRNCKRALVYGRNCRIRLKNGKITIYCLECKNFNRYPFSKKYNQPENPSNSGKKRKNQDSETKTIK